MTNQISVVRLNNSRIFYTKLVPDSNFPYVFSHKQYLQINKDAEPLLVETTSIMGKQYRGVTRDNIFWFLVEDLVPLNQSSKERLTLVEKLLTSIDNKHKGFICVVDARGDREYVLMVSSEGLKNKFFI